MDIASLKQHFRDNWKSGLAVSLINIPLSISLAVASLGADSVDAPLLGLITAIWAGATAAIFASSKHNIYGPAGALSGIILAFVMQKTGNIVYVPILAIVTGIMILIISSLRLTKYITLIPSSALHGFLLGVGITIASTQLNSALGITPHVQHEALYQNVLQTFSQIGETNWLAFLLFLISFVFLQIMKKIAPKIPGAIPLTVIGVALGGIATYLQNIHAWPAVLPVVQTIASKFPSLAFSLVDTPNFSSIRSDMFSDLETIKVIVRFSFVIAVIAILETIISAKIAEKMTKVGFDKDKEIFGLGMSNILSGIAGGLPATAVLVRTAFNAKSGANSRMSAFLTAVFTLFIGWLLFDFFKLLPMPVIAAILMNIALGMVDMNLYKNIHSLDKVSFYITIAVGIITVADDPIIGIIFGTAVSLIIFIGKVSNGNIEVSIFRDGKFFDKLPLMRYARIQEKHDTVVYRLSGTLNYLNIETALGQTKQLDKPSTIIFNFGQVNHIDIDGIETLEEIFEHLRECNIDLYFTGLINADVEATVRKLPIYTELEVSGKIHKSTALVLELMKIAK